MIGFVIVEVCESNLMSAYDLEQLEIIYPGVSVLRSECLSQCELCRQNPFALVNGALVFAETGDECYLLLQTHIEQEINAFME